MNGLIPSKIPYAIEKDIDALDTSLKEKCIVIFNRMKELRANATDTDMLII